MNKHWSRFRFVLGRGGDQVVSMLAFNSDDPNLNTADTLKFLFETNENKQKRGRGWPIEKS